MRRLFFIIACSMALSGCASFSTDMFRTDMFTSAPPPITVQLESLPPGADAVTSLGPACKTPCSVSVPSTPNFTVTFSAPKYLPATVPVSVIFTPGDFSTPASTTVDPNPVAVELQPAVPTKRVVKRAPVRRPTAARPAAAAPVAAAPAAAAAPRPVAAAPAASGSPFPAPTR